MRRLLLGSVLGILLLSLSAHPGRLFAQTSTTAPRTYAQLRTAALTTADLPGYSLDYEAPGALDGTLLVFADYDAIWTDERPASVHELVSLGLTSVQFIDVIGTPAGMANRYAATHANVTLLGSQGVGDDDQALFERASRPDGSSRDVYDLHFRRGMVLVDLFTVDQAGAGSLDQLLTLARVIDARLLSAGAGPVPSSAGY